MAAFLSLVLVSTLTSFQARDMSGALADKEAEENIVLEILEGDGEGETADFDEIASGELKKTIEEAIPSVENVELAKPYEPKTGYVITTTGTLNIRAEKNIDSEILGTLEPGGELWLEGEYEGWYMISYGDKKGYVAKELVTTSYAEAKDILLRDVMYERAVAAAGAEMKSAPTLDASPIELLQADKDVIIIARIDDNWSQVYTADDYTAGYVLNTALTVGDMVLKERVMSDRAEKIKEIGTQGVLYSAEGNVNVRTMPGEDKDIKITLASGTSCLLVKTIGDWVKISYGDGYTAGYVRNEYTMTKDAYNAMKAEQEAKLKAAEAAKQKKSTAAAKSSSKSSTKSAKSATAASIPYAAPSSKGQQIVNEASKYIGVRYVYGGTSPSGFDCSGLVQYACKKAGVSVNRSSRDQYKNGVAVSKSDLQPGDLVFFSKGSGISHVGIYAGGGQVIHSPRPGKSVCYISLASMCSYSTYVGARRVY